MTDQRNNPDQVKARESISSEGCLQKHVWGFFWGEHGWLERVYSSEAMDFGGSMGDDYGAVMTSPPVQPADSSTEEYFLSRQMSLVLIT